MTFIPFLDYAHRDRLRAVLAEYGARLCDFTLISLFMWAPLFKTAIAEEDGRIFIRAEDPTGGEEFYVLPYMGEAFFAAVSAVSRHTGGGIRIDGVPEREILALRKRYGEGIAVTTDPAESDYLYEIGDLATYAGRRYSQKRNHVNAFLREHGGAVYEPITEENLPAVRAFFDIYRREEEKDSPSAHAEGAAVVRVLEEFFDLSAEGGLLREGDRILGFFVGEVQGDTLYLHIEKATRAVRGAYPYLVQCAAKAYADRVRYENREEDDGDEGLRQSKHSYCPCALLEKYRVYLSP